MGHVQNEQAARVRGASGRGGAPDGRPEGVREDVRNREQKEPAPTPGSSLRLPPDAGDRLCVYSGAFRSRSAR